MLKKLKVIIWGRTPENPVEKSLLLKMDWFILSYVTLIYWVNYLDRTNLANAYVSGMQEDLNMKGKNFNLINTCFNIGYIVALIPHNLIMLKIRPRYWLTFCSFSWGVLTLSMYKVTSYKQLCVIRFFVAVFEAVTFSGTHLILGSFYDEDLLSFRTAIFTSAGLIGSIFSGILQAAIYKNMDGYHGIEGWRWLFIIDFLVTVPVVIYGFFCFPDAPNVSKAFYFTHEEHQLALQKQKKPRDQFSWNIFTRLFADWKWYCFSFLWVLGGENESFSTNSLLALWLKFHHYSVADRNHFPMGIFAVGVCATLSSAIYLNATGGKYHYRVGIFIAIVLFIAALLLLTNPLSKSFVFTAHYLSGFAYAGQTVFFAWANIATQDDLQVRAIVLASMNMFSNAVNAWWSLLFFAAPMVPKFRKGAIAMIATTLTSIIVCLLIRYLQLRNESKPRIFDDDTVSDKDVSLEAIDVIEKQ